MPKYPYLARAGKRGIWRYRRGVPVKLRPVIGAREILRSLRTPVLAEALARYAEVAADAERQLEKARTELEPGAKPVPSDDATSSDTRSDADVQQECALHYRTCHARERAFRHRARAQGPGRVPARRHPPAAHARGTVLRMPQYAFMDDSEGAYKVLLAMAYRQRLEQRAIVLRTLMLTQDVGGLSRALKHSSSVRLCTECTQKTGFDLARTELDLGVDQPSGRFLSAACTKLPFAGMLPSVHSKG